MAELLIDGRTVAGADGAYPIVNPSTEQVVGDAPEASVAQVEEAAAAAKAAFHNWSRTTPEERANLLDRLADVVRSHVDELIPLVQAETGATQRVASTMQVPIVAQRFRRYAQVEPNQIPLPPQQAYATALAPGGIVGAVAIRQPVGVVACITPYNFPIVNAAGKIAPALAMGNTVVIKPAPQNPQSFVQRGAGFLFRLVRPQQADQVEAGWAVVEPIQGAWSAETITRLPTYPAGSWGPSEADELLARDGRKWEVAYSPVCSFPA